MAIPAQNGAFQPTTARQVGRFCRDRLIELARAVIVVALLTAALAGCVPDSPTANPLSACGGPDLTAVAGDPSSGIYLIAGTWVVRAADSKLLATFTADGTTPALLAPQAGGFILLNGGAAARRYDATGTLVWTIGYADAIGVVGALLDGDQLALADAQAVYLYDASATPIWQRAIGTSNANTGTTVTAAAPDEAGGVWVLGTRSGWMDPFVVHLDRDGAQLAGSSDGAYASFDEAVGTTDAAGQPLLVARTHYADGVSEAAGIDSAGQIVWTQLLDQGARLVGDGAGNVYALADLQGSMQIDRWDATGKSVARQLSKVGISVEDQVAWTMGPDASGFLVAGHVTPSPNDQEAPCEPNDFLWQVDGADLTVTPEPLFPKTTSGANP
jgi:hypothetical protein